MAYFEKRGGGWLAQVRRRGMPTLSRTFDLKVDAENWAKEIERELQRGNTATLRQDAQRTTIAQAVDRYAADRLPALRSHATVKGHLARIRLRFGSYFIANVRSPDIAAWRADLLSQSLSNATVGHHMTTLSAVFSFIAKDLGIDLPGGNPCRLARKPTRPKGRERRLRPGEYEALQADRPELLAFIILALETSMRRGELVKLRWEHIDLARRTAHLPDTKNGEARTVALSSLAIAQLSTLPRRIDGHLWTWKTGDGFSGAWKRHVAQARRKHILSRLRDALTAEGHDADAEIRALIYHKRQPSQHTVDLFKQIDETDRFLKDLHFHDLRHEATSRLFEKGLGVMEVASMTGHKSLSMLKRYTHIEAQKLAAKLG